MNPRSTDYNVDALTTAPSRRYLLPSLTSFSFCHVAYPLSVTSQPSFTSSTSSMPPNSSSFSDLLGFSNETQKVLEPEVLNIFTLFCSNLHLQSNLNSSSFRIPGYSTWRFDRVHCQCGFLSPVDWHTSSGVVIFVRQGLSFPNLQSPLSLRWTLTLTMWGVNILKRNSSPFSFLIFTPPIRS